MLANSTIMVLNYLQTKLRNIFFPPFNEIVLTKETAEELFEISEYNHPKEFFAVLGGRISKYKLILDSILYQKFVSNENSASFVIDLPTNSGFKATFHSHPGYNNRPSNADLDVFRRFASINFILAKPYQTNSLACYDNHGNPIIFSIEKY